MMNKINQVNMIKVIKDLFPINRSILGPGFRKSLKYIKQIHPDLKIHSIKSGTKVFDWTVPKEWDVKEAYIMHSSGKKYADLKNSNLHIVSYSKKMNEIMSLEEIQKKIYTIPSKPNWIPYHTSYYKYDWGFCMTHNQKNSMPRGDYKIFINSSHKNGILQYGEYFKKGISKKEIFFSTYLCHPSMANDELSGPALCTKIIEYIKNNYKSSNYSYRVIFIPETIGSIAYLSKNFKKLKKNMISGYVLSCVGDERCFSHVESRTGKTLSDISLKAALIGKKNVKKYSFLHRGSDERQYCSPNINLPVSTFCRSKFGSYKEYHTSADNFNVVTKKGLDGSFQIIKSIIDSFECGLTPINNNFCEPMMANHDLYYKISPPPKLDKNIRLRMDLLAYMDGSLNIFELSSLLNQPLNIVRNEVELLIKNKLVSIKK